MSFAARTPDNQAMLRDKIKSEVVLPFLHTKEVQQRAILTTALQLPEAGMATMSRGGEESFVPMLDATSTRLLLEAMSDKHTLAARADFMDQAALHVTSFLTNKNLGCFGPCACTGMRVRVNKDESFEHQLKSGTVVRECITERRPTVVRLTSGEEIQVEEKYLQCTELCTVQEWLASKKNGQRGVKRKVDECTVDGQ